jgi:SAM-dependent methyltransferase
VADTQIPDDEAPSRVGRTAAGVDPDQAVAANRRWWDAEAAVYQAEHADFLGDADFVWCPEGLREADARLLGPIAGRRVLEVGCGAAPCARWLRAEGANVVASDLSFGQLAYAVAASARTGIDVPYVQADVGRLPFADGSFDLACSAFGAIPFVVDSGAAMREVARVLRPGGRWVFSVTHPFRWVFPDDPGPAGLAAVQSYFDRSPYVERDETGQLSYLEQHRTLGDRLAEITAAGFSLTALVEPAWPAGHERTWGQWSPLRGRLFPGTAIYVCEL